MRPLALALALVSLALPLASAEEYVAAGHVFAIALVEPQPVAGTQQTLVLDVFHNTTGIPVDGLADALTLTLVLGDITKKFPLSASEEVVGQYSTRFVPTEAGNYTARLTGMVNGASIEVVATLPEIRGAAALEFPQRTTVDARLDELETRIADAKKDTPGAGAILTLAILGLVAVARRLPGGGR